MMKNPRLTIATISSAALATLITACGGGGSANTSATAPSATGQTPTAPSTTATPLAGSIPTVPALPAIPATPTSNSRFQAPVQAIPAPSYPAGSAALSEFNALNEQRAQCNLGLLTDSLPLRRASENHATYLNTYYLQAMAPAGLSPHTQYTQFLNNFTGRTALDRLHYQGYKGLFEHETLIPYGPATDAVRAFLAAPYHAQVLLGTATDVGIASPAQGSSGAAVFEFGVTSKHQRLGDGVLTYPCQGTTGTALKLEGEVPSPYAPRNLRANPIGQPLYFFVYEKTLVLPPGQKTLIEVTDLVVSEVVSGAAVEMLNVMTAENDAAGSLMGIGFAYVAPHLPLKAMTQYRVKASVRSKADNKTSLVDYTFTTGS